MSCKTWSAALLLTATLVSPTTAMQSTGRPESRGMIGSPDELTMALASAGAPGLPSAKLTPPNHGYHGSPQHFGRLVDSYELRIIIADDTEASIYDRSTASFETVDLLATHGLSTTKVLDVAIQGQVAAVSFESGADTDAHVFLFTGGVWTHAGSLGVEGPGNHELEIHDGYLFRLWHHNTTSHSHLEVFDPADLAAGAPFNALDDQNISKLPIRLAVGPAESGTPGEISIVVTMEDDQAEDREVTDLHFDGNSLDKGGVFASGTTDDGFGDALAVGEGFAFIGQPFNDEGAPNGGKVTFYDNVGPSTDPVDAGSIVDVWPQAGSGRSLSFMFGVLGIGHREAELVAGATNVGAITFFGYDEIFSLFEGGTLYLHASDNEFSTGDDFSASFVFVADAIGGSDVIVGEPGNMGGAGTVHFYSVVGDGLFLAGNQLWLPGLWDTELAGTGGLAPFGALFGTPLDGAPCQLWITNTLPSSVGFLVYGVDLSVPNLLNSFAPAKGGLLYPEPQFIKAITTDAAGEVTLNFPWPPGVPGDLLIKLQYWMPDRGGPAGFAATPGFAVWML